MTQYENLYIESLRSDIPDEVRNYRYAGYPDKAVCAIDRWLQRDISKEMRDRLLIEKEQIGLLKEQFPYSEEEALETARKDIPDFSEEDLRKLDEDGVAEWIFIDGRKHYNACFWRTATHVVKDLEERVGGVSGAESAEVNTLGETIKKIKENGSLTCTTKAKVAIKLKDECFVPGRKLKVHLPVPALMFQTKEVKLTAFSHEPANIDSEKSMARTVYYEEAPMKNEEFFVETEYVTKAKYVDVMALADQADELSTYAGAPVPFILYADRAADHEAQDGSFDKTLADAEKADYEYLISEKDPHIRFTPYLRALSKEIVGDEKNPVRIAALIYDYITSHVKYSYMMPYFLIQDIPQYCARNLRGDCGVQALLFITLCRLNGIPAIWQSGLYMLEGSSGPHDWAMFYIKPLGWFYADPSFGGSAFRAGDEERRRFYFGNLDPYRYCANHEFQKELVPPCRFRRNDPYDNQVGEIETDDAGMQSCDFESTRSIIFQEEI